MNIIVKTIDARVTSYTIEGLSGYEGRIGDDRDGDYTVTLCGQGVYTMKHAGKVFTKKGAERAVKGWLLEMWDRFGAPGQK